MNPKFKIERSIYVMGLFIAAIGVFLLTVRSEAVLTFRYFSEPAGQEVLYQEVKGQASMPAYLIVTGPDQPKLAESLTSRLLLMKKDVNTRAVTSIQSETDLSGYEAVIVATEQLDLLTDPGVIRRFVEKGGTLFLATRPAPGPALSALYQPLGIVEAGAFIETTGVELKEPLIGNKGKTLFQTDQIINSSLALRISEKTEQIAASASGVPLLWKTHYGAGTFVVFNGTMFQFMNEQGLFVKGLQEASGHLMMPVVNARVTVIESFPFSVSEGRTLSETVTDRDYYRNTFWPAMQRLASKHELRYTAAYAAPENSEADSALLEDIRFYGRDLLRMGGEVALYEPTQLSGMRVNESIEHLEQSLSDYAVRSSVRSEAGGGRGAANITTILMPTTQVEAREGVMVLPETMEGFDTDDAAEWRMINAVASEGFYAHSIQPSRFLREGDLEKDITAFADFQQAVSDTLPWMPSMTLSEASEEAYTYTKSGLYEARSVDGNTITFRETAMKEGERVHYYFAADRPIAKTEQCEAVAIGDGLYMITSQELTFSITLEGSS